MSMSQQKITRFTANEPEPSPNLSKTKGSGSSKSRRRSKHRGVEILNPGAPSQFEFGSSSGVKTPAMSHINPSTNNPPAFTNFNPIMMNLLAPEVFHQILMLHQNQMMSGTFPNVSMTDIPTRNISPKNVNILNTCDSTSISTSQGSSIAPMEIQAAKNKQKMDYPSKAAISRSVPAKGIVIDSPVPVMIDSDSSIVKKMDNVGIASGSDYQSATTDDAKRKKKKDYDEHSPDGSNSGKKTRTDSI